MKQRVLTAALLIPPVLLAVFLSSFWAIWILALVATWVGCVELRRLVGESSKLPLGLATVILLFATPLNRYEDWEIGGLKYWKQYPLLLEFGESLGAAICVVALAIGVYGAVQIARGKRAYWVTECASLWLAAPLASMVLLKLPYTAQPLFDWRSRILFALVPLWIGDSLAIFVGRAFGKHPLAPKISPKKTVEGGIANLAGCIAGSIGLAVLIHQPILVGLLVGLATGILGQLGDLLESAMKRSAGVKDSGTLLPGHGGLLDRIDSILLSAPAVALIVATMGSR